MKTACFGPTGECLHPIPCEHACDLRVSPVTKFPAMGAVPPYPSQGGTVEIHPGPYFFTIDMNRSAEDSRQSWSPSIGDRELLQRALDALEHHREQTRPIHQNDEVIAALRSRLGNNP